MSGRVPPSTRVRGRMSRALQDAIDLYRDFTGLEPESIQKLRVRVPDAAFVLGECAGVLYDAIRDDGGVQKQHYIHRFRKGSRPLLCVSSDGKTLLILGGEFEVTERGIEDR